MDALETILPLMIRESVLPEPVKLATFPGHILGGRGGGGGFSEHYSWRKGESMHVVWRFLIEQQMA